VSGPTSQHRRDGPARVAILCAVAGTFLAGPALGDPGGEPPPPPPSAPAPSRPPTDPASPPPVAVVPAPPGAKPWHEPSWFAVPIVFYLPETNLGFGAGGGLHFGGLDGKTRQSNVFGLAMYTLGKQGFVDLAVERWGEGTSLLASRLRAVVFPDKFYGLGPDTTESDAEDFRRRWVELGALYEFPIVRDSFRAGPRVDLRAENVDQVEPGGQLASGTVAGVGSWQAVGLGASATYDTRDNPLYARRGAFAQAWAVGYPAMGGHGAFGRFGLELRGFVPLALPWPIVVGAMGYLETTLGTVPFTLLPKLGSVRFLRGFREGRFRDGTAWSLQTEVRAPIVWRFAAAAFVGVGDVAPNLWSFDGKDLKIAGGGGIRFRLTDAGANVRVDVAGSADGLHVYALLLEAF
jgi:hypothetical protein